MDTGSRSTSLNNARSLSSQTLQDSSPGRSEASVDNSMYFLLSREAKFTPSGFGGPVKYFAKILGVSLPSVKPMETSHDDRSVVLNVLAMTKL